MFIDSVNFYINILIIVFIITFYGIFGEILNSLHEKYYKKRTFIVWVPILREYILLKVVFGEIYSVVIFMGYLVLLATAIFVPVLFQYLGNIYKVARIILIIYIIAEYIYFKIKKLKRRKNS